jgi:hypothetical protein
MSTQEHYTTLVSFLLPEGLLDYFDVVDVTTKPEGLEIYLEEKNKAPEGFTDEQLHSKGFHEQIKVEDFPVRGKKAYLYIRRRRWEVKATGVIISRDWRIVQSGTRMTREFAAFLKGIFG